MNSSELIFRLIQVFLIVILMSQQPLAQNDPGNHQKEEKNYTICDTKECIDLANDLLGNMNKSTNPCDNFFQFSCGGWIEKNPIPDHKLNIYQFDMLKRQKNAQILEIFRDYNEENETMTSFQKAHKVFESCMNTDAIERHGVQPLLDFLIENGGWPLLKPRKNSNEELAWQKIVPSYLAKGIETLIYVDLSTDYVKRNENYLTLVPIQSNIFKGASNATHYKNIIKDIVAVISPGFKITQELDQDIDDMIRFQNTLAEIGIVGGQMDFDQYKIHTIEKFQNIYDENNPKTNVAKINWLEFYQLIVEPYGENIITNNSKILVSPFNVSQFVSMLDQTSPRTIVNYVHWKFIHTMMPYTVELFRNHSIALDATVGKVPPPRQVQCIEQVEPEHAVAFKYVTKYFSHERKETALRIIEEIKTEIPKKIKNASWLKDDEKKIIYMKLGYLATRIGYPDWYSREEIDKYYEKLVIGDNYLDNQLAILRFRKRISFKKISTPYSSTEWIETPLWTGACYSQLNNYMLFPAAFLQKPFFESGSVPIPAIYATFGSVAGHELMHSFDSWGASFDQHGKYRKWWSNETYTEFNEKVQCFVDQFNNYLAFEPLNMTGFGDWYSYEEIADTVGVQTAFDVFKSLTKNKQDIRLPGLENFSGEQLFFLVFARTHCSAEKPEYFTSGAALDEGHDLPFLRLRGAISNMKSFSDAFGCEKGSLFNPEKKCSLWN